jgi:GNAT superfamily N-acetyltransferase
MSAILPPRIPPIAHFCWIGETLPWIYAIAVRSACLFGELDRVVFHHTDEIRDAEPWRFIAESPNIETRRFDPTALFEGLTERSDAQAPDGAHLSALYEALSSPVSRSNMLRAAVLYREGGVYLDLDTITVRSMRPLLGVNHFCGVEHIVRPYTLWRSRSRLKKARATALSLLRNGFRLLPQGHRVFPAVSGMYAEAINGAIFGACEKSPLMARYLDAMLELPIDRARAPHGVGTHLLQETIDRWQAGGHADSGRGALAVHPPRVFYPLAPEISEHWFRPQRRVSLDHFLHSETVVAHWYASGRAKKYIGLVNPAFVRENAATIPYCALAKKTIEG